MLIIFSGLPGVGKTTVARLVAQRMKAVFIRIDTIEQALRGSGAAGAIGPEGHFVACRVAADNLALGHSVVADGVNASEAPRAGWRKVAQESGKRSLFVQLACSDAEEHRRRLEVRKPDLPGHVLPTWLEVASMHFVPPPSDALVLDTARLEPGAAADEIVLRAR